EPWAYHRDFIVVVVSTTLLTTAMFVPAPARTNITSLSVPGSPFVWVIKFVQLSELPQFVSAPALAVHIRGSGANKGLMLIVNAIAVELVWPLPMALIFRT